MPKEKAVLVQLPPDLWQRAKDRASLLNVSPSVVTADALRLLLGEQTVTADVAAQKLAEAFQAVTVTAVSNYVASNSGTTGSGSGTSFTITGNVNQSPDSTNQLRSKKRTR